MPRFHNNSSRQSRRSNEKSRRERRVRQSRRPRSALRLETLEHRQLMAADAFDLSELVAEPSPVVAATEESQGNSELAAPANSAAALDWYLQQRVANNLWCANHADEVSSKSSLKTRLRAHIDCVPGRGGSSIVYVGADGATESTHLHAVHGYGTSSTIKIGIAYAVARAIDANSGDGITWNTLVNVGSQYGTNQSGTLTANQNFTVRYLVQTMLANSNNWATNRLVDFLTTGSTHGMGFINQQFASLGLNVTHMERYMTGTGSPSAHGNGSSPADYRDGYDNISSPAEITQLLRFVTDNYHPAIGTLLTASSYEAFWEAMSLDGDQMTPTDNDSVYEKGDFNDFFSDDIFPDWEDAATQASKAGSNCWGFSSDCTNPAVAEVGDYDHKPQIGAHLQRSDAGRLTFADGSQAFFGVFIDEAEGPNTQPLRDAIGCVGFETFVEYGRNIVARTPSDCELSDGQVLTVNGTDAADDIVISYDSPTLTIDLNGQVIAVDTGGIDRLVINGFGGKDEITFESLRFGLPTKVNAGDGADTIHIGDGTVGDVQSVIDVNGDGGADKLRIFGQDQTGEDEYRVRKNHVKWKGSKLVNYDSIATLSLKANGKDNTIHVDSLDAETDLTIRSRGGADTIRIGTGSGKVRGDVTVFAGNGADVIRIGNGDVDSRVLGSVTVHGEGGHDELRIEDSDDQHGDDSYTIDASYFQKDNIEPVKYDGIEELLLKASDRDNVIWVESTSAATEVRGGDGDDVILVTPEAKRMSLANNLLVEGGPGVDGLAIHDQNNPYTFGGGHHYNVTPLSVSRTHGYFVAGGGFVVGMTDVDYKHVEILTVYAGQQADMVSVTPSVKTSYWILGGDPDAGTGDTIDIDTGNLINPDFDPFPGSTNGILQSDLHGDVTFSQFETVHGLGLLPIESAGYTPPGAADGDSPFEPNVQEIVPTHAVVTLSPSEMRRLPIDESVSSDDEFLRAIDSVVDEWEHFSDDLLLEVRLDGLTLD